mmetsp:Transcript_11055/g.12650  ORF Transcript_11055/g.12650 Transcript_11055/m.12650 type:complete len:387 (+) Transcript_11055:378-1538(+)|eukprot:CAMPEP_0184022094 /NCGR_PEP_ID=MMETSP0954-20121128/10372_1 /TAXON_ID=627963 /ORGANISM="Aplanochytrium sp, Strain PBS07" /LENGTH=386 /DNA_ID=CAMNT_0026304345 /DNA_START=285 /DNA_END=1445 /DNA_ORIENTATION=-
MAYSRKHTFWVAYALLLLQIGCVSRVNAQAEGDILAYEHDWVVAESNTVNATLTMQISVTSGSLSSFSQGVLALSGGGSVENMVVADGVGVLATGTFFSSSDDDLIRYLVPLRETLRSSNSPLTLTYSYTINNYVCSDGGKQVFRTRYLNDLNVDTFNIQQRIFLPLGTSLSFSPGPASVNVVTSSNSTTAVAEYTDSQLGIGDGVPNGEYSRISWSEAFVANTQQCPDIPEESNIFLIALILVPSIAVTCLVVSGVYHRFYAYHHPDAPSPFRLNMFPGNNVIVLSPTDNIETVEAVIHDDEDALDNIVPVTNIRVSIDEYYPPGASEPLRVPRPQSGVDSQMAMEMGVDEVSDGDNDNDDDAGDDNEVQAPAPPAKEQGSEASL